MISDTPNQPRLLLNAEPFGFGPTAAIAAFFPYLRPHFANIGYMGKKHTLDLQRGLPYDAIHDVTDTPKAERAATYAPIFAQYDILLTAMDHKIAESAQQAGLQVYYYDALAWYWPDIPDSVKACDLYLAQDFYGVGDRLGQEFATHPAAHIVAPITPSIIPQTDKQHVLLNLGGLQNPFWPVEDVIDYARTIITCTRNALPTDTKLVIAGSATVAKSLGHLGVKTYDKDEMQTILAQSHVAFMTPGLGNIYDAAAYSLPTIWLPPANDSQGQQLDIIRSYAAIDGAIDWSDILPGAHIIYKDEQPIVLNQIAQSATQLTHNSAAQQQLQQAIKQHFADCMQTDNCKIAQLRTLFGTGGEQAVTDHVITAAKNYDRRGGNAPSL